jgi:uncharacterized phiE125 gp8 family phage protein
MVTDVNFTPATLEIVSLAKAKKQLRLETSFTDEDDLIQAYIDAAVIASENFIGGHIQQKNMLITMDSFDSPIEFEAFPMQSITTVKYFPADGSAEATMDDTLYKLTKVNDKVFSLRFVNDVPEIAERFDAVTITIVVGFATNKTPKPILQAILLQVADMYERREDRSEVFGTTAMALLRPYKKY